MSRPVAYICSPYRGDTNKHTIYARRLVSYALQQGYAPICPHLYLTQVLDDNDPDEREQGLQAGLELLRVCDVVVVGYQYGISEGMKAELDLAEDTGKKIIYINVKE